MDVYFHLLNAGLQAHTSHLFLMLFNICSRDQTKDVYVQRKHFLDWAVSQVDATSVCLKLLIWKAWATARPSQVTAGVKWSNDYKIAST